MSADYRTTYYKCKTILRGVLCLCWTSIHGHASSALVRAWGGNWGRWFCPQTTSGDRWDTHREFRDLDSSQAWFLVLALPLHCEALLERHRRLAR